ncbi:MAG: hypothetical protein WAK82_36255 [Streptosporangiaceae bacterium]
MALRDSGTSAGRDEAGLVGTEPRDLDLRPASGSGSVQVQPGRWRRRARAAVARADHPGVTALIMLTATTGFVLARWDLWSQRTISRFILIGQHFAHPAQLPPGMPLRPAYGYDGQFFYRLAINPLNFSHTAYGITVDRAYRFMRVGYPALTWVFSFGQRALVPYMLVAVNVAALTALAALGAVIARQGGRHAAWGLLLPAYFGLVTSLSRDTAEPVAAAFLVAGLLAIRARRPVLAGSLLAFAALTRETAMVAVAALAAVRLAGLIRGRHRPGREDVAWVLPAAVFAAWQVLIYAAAGTFPLLADGGRNAGAPFIAPVEAFRTNLSQIDWSSYSPADLWLAEMAVLLLFAVAALSSLRTSRAPVHERLALILFLFEICLVTPDTWSSRSADLRSFVEVYLMAVIVLLGRPRQRISRAGGWLLPAAAVGLAPVLGDIVSLRLHWA